MKNLMQKKAGHKIEQLRERAKKDPKRIILPEAGDPRVLKAASFVARLDMANLILVGKESRIKKAAPESSLPLDKVRIIDPETHTDTEKIIDTFYELRKHKGITRDEARDTVLKNTVYYGALLVRLGAGDGFVAGASNTTGNVARASIYCIGMEEGISIMSSSFVVEVENCPYGDDGLFIFADCGIVPDPDENELADIAVSTSKLYRELFKRDGRVALLSYSTKGSAKGDSIDKVRKALEILKKKAPGMMVDGELQADAAIVPDVAKIKAPKSALAGSADILIFPNLDSGNIAYKLTQRLGNARVLGPLLQGIKKPGSDLSRGCFVEEIIDTIAATVVRAQ